MQVKQQLKVDEIRNNIADRFIERLVVKTKEGDIKKEIKEEITEIHIMKDIFKKMEEEIGIEMNVGEGAVPRNHTELNDEALKHIIDIARPTKKVENILKYLN